MGPVQPPAGFRWTPQAKGFYDLVPAVGPTAGFAALVIAPFLLWRLIKTLRARRNYLRSGSAGSSVVNDIFVQTAQDRLRSACAESNTLPPFSDHGGGEFRVFGAGSTPESTLDLPWAKVFIEQNPDRKSQAAEACDLKLRAIPFYFVYALGLASICLIASGILDAENKGWLGFLAVPGIILSLAGLPLVLMPWMEGGLNEFRKTFAQGLFSSWALRRYWLAVTLCALGIAAVVPAYRYGARTHPFLTYSTYYDSLGWGVHLEYPRDWRRQPSLLIMQRQPQASINIFPDPHLTTDAEAAYAKLKAELERLDAIMGNTDQPSWRIDPLAWSGGRGWQVDQRDGSGRILTAYVPAPKGWYVLRMADVEPKASHEEAFRRLLSTVRILNSGILGTPYSIQN